MKKKKKLKFKKKIASDGSVAYAVACPLGKDNYPQYCLQGDRPAFDLKLKKSKKFTLFEIYENFGDIILFKDQPMSYKHAKKFASKFWRKRNSENRSYK